jgi:putative ABC transport system permease protein
MNLRDWTHRLKALVMPRRVERDLHDELSFHIERETKKLIDEGMEPARARNTAKARFGSTTVAADACRDERGTAFVDNTIHDVQYAMRTFRRGPLAAITIVVTVAIGLGVVAALFTILNRFLFRVDAVPEISAMYGVERPRANGDRSLLTRPQFEALRKETRVFTDAYASLHDIDLRVDGQTMAVTLVSGNFFQVVGVGSVLGRALSPSDDERSGGNAVLVLSDKGWTRRFDRDPNVLKRTVVVNGQPFDIIGVMPEGFRGLEVSAPDFWAPLSLLAQFRPGDRGQEDSVGLDVVGRLRPGVAMESARAQLSAWHSNQQVSAADRHTLTIDLVPRRGTLPQPMEAIAVFAPLFFAFGLILLIGCANVANLLLARGVARQREIGIRLSLGASRRRIVRQLMTESLLLALVAAAAGYVVSRLTLEGSVYWAMRVMPVDLGDVNINVPAADWRVAMFLVVAAVAATGFFALMPALQATRIEPARTLRGELVKDARPGRARNALIGVQVFASALLLICAAIFLRSAIASSRFEPGFRTADTVMIEIVNEPQRAALLQALAAESTITASAAVRPGILDQRAGFADTGAGKKNVPYKFVSGAYFDVMGIPILRGRSFTAAEREEDAVVIVSESTARMLWPNRDAVGETLRLEPDMNSPTQPRDEPPTPSRAVTVVGVSRDVTGFRFAGLEGSMVYLPTTLDVPKTSAMARVSGDPDLARQTLLDHLTRIDPNVGMIVTMRTVARLERFFLNIAFWIALILGSLALLLTVSGLFSVLSYLVEQRTKEIGVRMALGASSQEITQLMLWQTARPVMYGLAAGAGLAMTLATALLTTEAGAFISGIVRVTDPIAYAASLLVVVAGCLLAVWIPATRAARVDPMRTLRQE